MDSDGERSASRRAPVIGVVVDPSTLLGVAVSEVERRAATGGAMAAVFGVITEQLPSGLYRVRLDAGPQVTAHIADRMERNFIRLLVGDRVEVELSPVDLNRGRIVSKVA